MNKKYVLTNKDNFGYGNILHRIQKVKYFGDVRAGGNLGGWVESEYNLSHDGTCWIYDDAVVRNNAYVSDDSKITGNAIIQDYARIGGDAVISEHAVVRNRARVGNKAQISGYSRIGGDTEIFSNAIVKGNASIKGFAKIGKNAYITSNDDFFCIDNIGPREATVTFYVDKDRNIYVATGCFNDTLGAFEEVVKETYGNDKYAEQYYLAIQLAKARLR